MRVRLAPPWPRGRRAWPPRDGGNRGRSSWTPRSERDLQSGREDAVRLLKGRLRLVIEADHVGELQRDRLREGRHQLGAAVHARVAGLLEVGQDLGRELSVAPLAEGSAVG